MPTLVLMRHGATLWGQENRFAGWADTPLSNTGVKEAESATRTLAKAGLAFDICFTSHLKRARQTLEIVAGSKGPTIGNIISDWRLNERHYGALQGETREAMVERYGNQQVVAWRRSYAAVPPPLSEDDPRWREQLQRLPDIPVDDQPRSESMATAALRVEPVWHARMAPELKAGKQLLVVAHTSSIRGLARLIEGLNDQEAEDFRIATAIPLVYLLDDDLKIIRRTDLSEGLVNSWRHWTNRLKPRRLGWI
ncbi:MAG: 2,3-bisphosphoglycerate-dependent phosphoglycerate mutase [Aestuariivirga sp.]